jgi:hypothetical protein
MKKLIFFILLSNVCFAQNVFQWADSGAVWHLSSGSMIGLGYQKMEYEKDTIINNQQCQKISRMSQIRQQIGPGTFVVGPLTNDESYFVYKSNDSVFSYHNNQFFLAFKTNGFVGEIWDLGKLNVDDTMQHAYVKVDSVYFETYNGQSLRNIKIHACDMNGDSIIYNGVNPDTALTALIAPDYIGSIVNEKFGPMQGFNGINLAYPNFGIIEYMPANMLCYQSATFASIQFNTTDCFNNIFVGIEEPMDSDLLIYPNPAQNEFYINSNEIVSEIWVTDLLGKVVVQRIYNQKNVNLHIAESGVYIVFLKTKHGVSQRKMVIK